LKQEIISPKKRETLTEPHYNEKSTCQDFSYHFESFSSLHGSTVQ